MYDKKENHMQCGIIKLYKVLILGKSLLIFTEYIVNRHFLTESVLILAM